MADQLNELAQVQLALGTVNVRMEVLAEAVTDAATALCNIAEEARARSEFDLCEKALDAVDELREKIAPLAQPLTE